jgi:hypothetical protein
MGKCWVGFSNFATSTAAKTAAKVIGAAGKIFEVVEIGAYGSGVVAPADVQHNVNCGFLTNGGAGSGNASPTPEPIHKAGAASGLTAGTGYATTEPTTYVTNVPQLFSFNQRGGMRWAVPINEGFQPDAVTNFSFGWRIISSAVGAIDGNAFWWE